MKLVSLANPTFFLRLSGRALPFLWGLAGLLLVIGLYTGLFVAPPDYQQGETVRIMYIHVPSAWLAMLCWGLMAVAALGTLVWRHPLADVAQKAAAPIGACFAFLALATGALWGQPTWGAWWVWDARLTTMLILFLMYLGVVAVWHAVEDPGRAAKAVSILTLVGAIDLPVIKFSVDWWSSLHQGESIFRADGASIDGSMLRPLLVTTAAAMLLFAALLLMAMRTEILRRRLRTLRISAAEAG